MAQYYMIFTEIGKAKKANAEITGITLKITEMAAGDGDGEYYQPTEDQIALLNEVWRGRSTSSMWMRTIQPGL